MKIIKDYFEKRKMKKMFSKYVNPKVIEKILSGEYNEEFEKIEKSKKIILNLSNYGSKNLFSKELYENIERANIIEHFTCSTVLIPSFYTWKEKYSEKVDEVSRVLKDIFEKNKEKVRFIISSGEVNVGNIKIGSRFDYDIFGDIVYDSKEGIYLLDRNYSWVTKDIKNLLEMETGEVVRINSLEFHKII